ncbi:hypothetical protein [Gordonia soli]|uniref:Uncharacterized protein n=1 Tax=Gordonia soli NBRC 108243 TaxID=1223545 RepID=M0QPH6_9ACTN|nr:hypothetical protein [Gordonia soli]GAC70463.1 hypothetical protein GS4_35_00390 [Gordonia soli NBRC 108243]
MHPLTRTLDQVRGSVVGTSSAVTAIVGHAVAGGGLPDTTSAAIVVAVCAALGWAVAALGSASTSGPVTLVVTLVGGQAIAHLALTAMAHHHAAVWTSAMLGCHVAATIIAAGLAMGLESAAVAVLCAIVRSLMHLRTAPLGAAPMWVAHIASGPMSGRSRLRARPVGTRGPPAPVF